jgi:hypothetical protein
MCLFMFHKSFKTTCIYIPCVMKHEINNVVIQLLFNNSAANKLVCTSYPIRNKNALISLL